MSGRTRQGREPDFYASEPRAGMALPLLPTLIVAALVGATALCREPAEPGPETRAAAPGAAQELVGDPAIEVAGTTPLPASIAFAQQFPMNAEIWVIPAAAQAGGKTEPPRLAPTRTARVAAPRPACSGPRCGEAASIRSGDARAGAPASPAAVPGQSAEMEESPFAALPDLALPFAPAVRAVGRTAGFLGEQAAAARTEAVALRDAVVELAGAIR